MEGSSIINVIWLVCIGMLSLVIILLIVMRRSEDRINREKLEKQALSILHKKELLSNSIQAQEKERDRLSAELHDGIVSRLNIVHLKFASIESKIPVSITGQLMSIKELLQSTIEDTRRISHELFPAVLESFGLITALEEFQELNASENLKIELHTKLKNKDFQMKVAVNLYRIVQELVNNSIKHSNGTKITINLVRKAGGYQLTYQDNGSGNLKAIEQSKGLGLKSISSRVSVLEGGINIKETEKGLLFIINVLNENTDD